MPDRNLLELEILGMQGPEVWVDWHLVGDSLQPLGTEKKEAQAFAMSPTMNSFQSFSCQIKDVQSILYEPAISPGTGCTRNLSGFSSCGQHF